MGRPGARLLDRFGLRVSGGRYIRGLIVKRLPGLIRQLFMRRAHLADYVVPAVIPGNPGLSIHQRPGSMGCPKRLPGTAVGIQRNKERVSIGTLTHFPLADKIGAPRRHSAESGTLELDARNVGSCNFFLMAIFKNNGGRSLEVDALDFGHGEPLPVPVLEYQDHGAVVIGRVGPRPARASDQQIDKYSSESNETAHISSQAKRGIQQTVFPSIDTESRRNLFHVERIVRRLI